MNKDKIIAEAQFSSKLMMYMYLEGFLVLLATIIGIPFMIVWFFVGMEWARRRHKALSCVLTEKNLAVKKGVLFRLHKTIPLEKITDLALVEGPILRWLGICRLKIETAGQSAQGSANADMTGIIDAKGFRDVVLAQRDRLEELKIMPREAAPVTGAPGGGSVESLLTDIRDSLGRIEKRLNDTDA